MTKLSDLPQNPETEAQFRRGFTHGAYEVFRAIESDLPPEKLRLVKEWLEVEVPLWRKDSDTFEAPSLSNFLTI